MHVYVYAAAFYIMRCSPASDGGWDRFVYLISCNNTLFGMFGLDSNENVYYIDYIATLHYID